MPRQTLIKKNYSFIGGLNSDSGYLQQVPNSWRDGDNITPFLDGHIERRVKLDLELSHQNTTAFTSTVRSTYAFAVDLWKNVGGDGNLSFAVVQVGNLVYFYDCVSPTVSANIKSFSIDLATYKAPTSPNVVGTSQIAIANANGTLVIVSADIDPILVEYSSATDAITVTRLTLKIRDFYGIVDSTAITTNPAALTDLHHYNLLNQGWLEAHIVSYFATTSTYPDDTQIWLQGKDTSDNFSPSLLDKQDFGTGAAPKGRYILDLFDRDRATASGIVGLAKETENYRPVATAFFAGRAWYAGTQSSTIGSWVLFSRIADTTIKYEQCYQEGDPTAEFTNDLISSDGGVIPIMGAGGILALKALQDSLLVFARNGIWQILGDASGFRADGYQVRQIATFGIQSAKAIVEVESTLMFWSTAGIYTLERDQVTGDYTPKSLSLGKIQTRYNTYQTTSHVDYAQGFYDNINKVVYWMHHIHTTGEAFDATNRFDCENFLLYNVALGAFYTYSLKSDSVLATVVGGFMSPNAGNVSTTYTVIAGADSVVVGANTVVATDTVASSSTRIPKFLTLVPSGSNYVATFSDFLNLLDTPSKFKDWYTVNTAGVETDVLPFVLTGYDIEDDGAKNHQAPYIITHMIKTEDGFDGSLDAENVSSCTLQGRWEWTDLAAASRWTSGEEVYRHRNLYVPVDANDNYDDGYPLVVAKTKLRGKGKALQLKFSSATGKEMKIAGWAIHYMINTSV